MRPRDRRAVFFLLIWCGGLGAYFGGKILLRLRQDWIQAERKLAKLEGQQRSLEPVLKEGATERANHAAAFPKEWQSLSPDQLRLKGQDALLMAAQRAGLSGIRLRAELSGHATFGKQLGWTLEGEGTLGQWVGAFEAIEKSQVFMRVSGFRLDLPGDPWHPEAQGENGPSLKGAVQCIWVVGP